MEILGIDTELVVFDHLGSSGDHTKFSEFLRPSEEEEDFVPEPPASLKDTAVIFFSSGTTGFPKGILISHYAIICQSVNSL